MNPAAFASTLALLAATTATAQPAPAGYAPGALTRDVMALGAMCRDSGGKPGKSPGLIQQADLTGDRLTDFVLDLNTYNCEGAASAMGAGQSGGAISIYVGGPGNTARKVWEGLAFEAKVEGKGSKARVWLAIQGRDCGQRNAANVAMADQKGCSRPLNWNPAKGTFAYAPLAEAKPFNVQ
jgi:hypothetical protein